MHTLYLRPSYEISSLGRLRGAIHLSGETFFATVQFPTIAPSDSEALASCIETAEREICLTLFEMIQARFPAPAGAR